jgi:hypothetical protein
VQLTIYVPKAKGYILKNLENTAKLTNRQKNELVLEALEKYLPELPLELRTFKMGDARLPDRAEIYDSREQFNFD